MPPEYIPKIKSLWVCRKEGEGTSDYKTMDHLFLSIHLINSNQINQSDEAYRPSLLSSLFYLKNVLVTARPNAQEAMTKAQADFPLIRCAAKGRKGLFTWWVKNDEDSEMAQCGIKEMIWYRGMISSSFLPDEERQTERQQSPHHHHHDLTLSISTS